jgi:two-component system, NarL family, nitrate/nitrite response regulator NarL
LQIHANPNTGAGFACEPRVMALRCLIVDDSAAFLEAASKLLEQEGVPVVGCASTAADGLALAGELYPDVILVDIALARTSGLDLARDLAASCTGATVILICTRAESDYADLVAETPAAGIVGKSRLSAAAIERLAEGA